MQPNPGDIVGFQCWSAHYGRLGRYVGQHPELREKAIVELDGRQIYASYRSLCEPHLSEARQEATNNSDINEWLSDCINKASTRHKDLSTASERIANDMFETFKRDFKRCIELWEGDFNVPIWHSGFTMKNATSRDILAGRLMEDLKGSRFFVGCDPASYLVSVYFLGTPTQRILVKTKFCKNWKQKGVCEFGNACCYAHSARELLTPEGFSQYKTKQCYWFANGLCAKGDACFYLHYSPNKQS